MQRHKAIIAASVVSATLLVGAAGISLNNALAGSDDGPGRLNPVSVEGEQQVSTSPATSSSPSSREESAGIFDDEFESEDFDDEDDSDDDHEEDRDGEHEYEGGEDDD